MSAIPSLVLGMEISGIAHHSIFYIEKKKILCYQQNLQCLKIDRVSANSSKLTPINCNDNKAS